MISGTNNSTIGSRVLKTEPIEWKQLKFLQDDNFKEWIDGGDKKLLQSIVRYQFIDSFKVWENEGNLYCLDGKHRYLDLLKAEENGISVPKCLPGTFIDCSDIKEAAELVLVYSSAYAQITEQGLQNYISKFDLDFPDLKGLFNLPSVDMIQFEGLTKDKGVEKQILFQSLQEKFIVPPFSVLDSRQGYWQERKKKWHSLGIDSQETREDIEIVAKSGQAPAIYELKNKMRETLGREPEWDEILDYAKKKGLHLYEGASIFDPVLAEICYKWFCPAGGTILDPFAGGSVRGIVAGTLGYPYIGIDLRQDQVDANRKQWETIKEDVSGVSWMCGDSNQVVPAIPEKVDFIFSCPPYHDLEKYSDDPLDLSNMDYRKFIKVYDEIIGKSLLKLKPNRFACFVVSDIRGKDGFYKGFVPDTIECFESNGALLYNEIILLNVAGSLPIRIGRQFGTYRKVGKMHQNVLVFYNGDPKKIKEEFPEINVEKDLQELNYQPNIALSIVDD